MTGQSWFSRVGWRHLVALGACVFALFPILYVVSAAFNPLGTLSSSQLLPNGFSLVNFDRLLSLHETVVEAVQASRAEG